MRNELELRFCFHRLSNEYWYMCFMLDCIASNIQVQSFDRNREQGCHPVKLSLIDEKADVSLELLQGCEFAQCAQEFDIVCPSSQDF